MRERVNHSHKLIALLMLAILLFFAQQIKSADDKVTEGQAHVAVFSIKGAIGPATSDYLLRAMEEARENNARLFVVTLDTPGGLDAATRDIIKAIIASDTPVVMYVHPAGSRAASAGTYILYASHVAAMTPSTTLGAATPVSLGSPGLPSLPQQDQQPQSDNEDSDKKPEDAPAGGAMERKVINDAIAFIRGLAKRHERNEDWAEEAVRSAATLTATEALEKNVIDVTAENIPELLQKIHGRTVRMENGEKQIHSDDLALQYYEPDWRSQLLSAITNPQIAYLFLMIGIYGLILEGYNPGALVPGIVGAISLLIAFYALQVLPVNYAGLGLIILGVLLIVAENMAPSFGILGIGGVIATTLGSIMLIDSDVPGIQISRPLIGGVAAASSLLIFAILYALGKSLKMKRPDSEKAMVGCSGTVESFENGVCMIHIGGELWEADSNEALAPGQNVRVASQNGLRLSVTKIEDTQS